MLMIQCGKSDTSSPVPTPVPVPALLYNTSVKIDNTNASTSDVNYNVKNSPTIRLAFTNALNRSTVSTSVSILENGATSTTINYSYENSDSTLVVTPSASLKYLTRYNVIVNTNLKSVKDGKLSTDLSFQFNTQIDSSNKFATISDNALLDLIQQKTFTYFWDFGHPVSGLARKRRLFFFI